MKVQSVKTFIKDLVENNFSLEKMSYETWITKTTKRFVFKNPKTQESVEINLNSDKSLFETLNELLDK